MSDAGIGMETAATAATNRAGNEARERTREEKCMGNPVSPARYLLVESKRRKGLWFMLLGRGSWDIDRLLPRYLRK